GHGRAESSADGVPFAIVLQSVGGIEPGNFKEFVCGKILIIRDAICIHAILAIKNERAFDDIAARGQIDEILVSRTTREKNRQRDKAKSPANFQHPVFFLHAPSFFNSSQLPVICRRCVLMEKPRRRVISLSSFSILSLSNSTIFSQSLQMM